MSFSQRTLSSLTACENSSVVISQGVMPAENSLARTSSDRNAREAALPIALTTSGGRLRGPTRAFQVLNSFPG